MPTGPPAATKQGAHHASACLVADDDDKAPMEIDERFHTLLYQAADNKFLAETLDRLGDVRGAMEQHIAITEALKAGDGARAEALLRQHIADFQQRIRAVL